MSGADPFRQRKPYANAKPGESWFVIVPIDRMPLRSFYTKIADDHAVRPEAAMPVRGIALDGVHGVPLPLVAVAPPDGSRMFPAVAGSDALEYHLLACDSAAMALTQPARPRTARPADVDKVPDAYQAPIPALLS